MNENILVAVAWPYANADIHVGNITGSHLPGDIVARYHRLRGNKVLMVSGSDSHGTAITIKADQTGQTPHEIYTHFHPRFIELFTRLGISYDIFTSTHTENHFEIAQKVFLTLLDNGYLTRSVSKQWYSPKLERFLPDRYVEGTCYICGNEGARSDQCEKCGNELEPDLLINPVSKVDDSTPELKETEHFYLDLSTLEPKIQEFLTARESYWRPNVLRQSLGNIRSVGLKPTSITRDLDWGIPVPLDGWEGKCLYVWFEAVMGYLASTVEWGKLNDQPEIWRDWWTNQNAKSFYFIGKDNITFHAVTWPAELLGMGKDFDARMDAEDPEALVLPYDVPANEFMNLEGRKISGSKNWAVWGLDALERYDSDALRYYLTVAMPENRDTDWDWEEFYQRNNNELVATWGNLVNRVLSFTWKNFDGKIPEPGELRESDRELLATIREGFESVGSRIDRVELKAALSETMRLASEVNRYLDVHAPWFEIKTDRDQAAKSLYTAIQAIDWLRIMFAPFLPETSEKLSQMLSGVGSMFGTPVTQIVEDALGEHSILVLDQTDALAQQGKENWQPVQIQPGAPFKQPVALFKKLDHSIVDEERDRLG